MREHRKKEGETETILQGKRNPEEKLVQSTTGGPTGRGTRKPVVVWRGNICSNREGHACGHKKTEKERSCQEKKNWSTKWNGGEKEKGEEKISFGRKGREEGKTAPKAAIFRF